MEDPGNEVGNTCDGNNVSVTMCPRSQGPYDFDFVFKDEYCKTDWLALPCVTTWKKSLRYSKRTLRELLSGFYRDVCLRVRVETERMFCHI